MDSNTENASIEVGTMNSLSGATITTGNGETVNIVSRTETVVDSDDIKNIKEEMKETESFLQKHKIIIIVVLLLLIAGGAFYLLSRKSKDTVELKA